MAAPKAKGKARKRRMLDQINAARIMSSPVALVRDTARIREASQIMSRRRISAVAVIDARGGVTGILTASDIVRFEPHHRCRVFSEKRGYHIECLGDELVSRVMTRGLLTVSPSETVSEVARRMVENNMHRVIVEGKGRVAGIVTAMDLARCLWKASDGSAEPGGNERPRRLDPGKRRKSP